MSCKEKNPVIGIIMGSDSDMPDMEPVYYTPLNDLQD